MLIFIDFLIVFLVILTNINIYKIRKEIKKQDETLNDLKYETTEKYRDHKVDILMVAADVLRLHPPNENRPKE